MNNEKITLSMLVNKLQDIAHQGYALYEIDLNLETHALCGIEIDHENKVILLKSEKK